MINNISGKINILFINNGGIYCGGTENRVRTLIENLVSNKYINNAFVLFNENEQKNKSDNKKIRLIKFNKLNIKQRVLEIIKKEDIKLVQIHNLPGIDLSFIKEIKNKKIPLIYFSHDLWPLCGMNHFIPYNKADSHKICSKTKISKCIPCIGLRTYIKLKKNQKYLNMCDVGIAPSCSFQAIFKNHNILNKKWKVINPWIDNYFLTKPKKTVKRTIDILFVGPFTEYKGFGVLLNAFRKIIKELPKINLKVISDINKDNKENYSLFMKYMKKVEIYNLKKNITFVDRRNKQELKNEYVKSKILVFPTQCMESFGQVWAEAAAGGAQIIISNIPSLKHYYPYYHVFKTGNHNDLSQKILQILKKIKTETKTNKQNSSDKAYHFIKKNFNIDSSSKEMMKIYNSLLITNK